MEKSTVSLYRISQLDLELCVRMNRVSHVRFWRGLFRGISRLGNGVFWYLLAATLPIIYGTTAWPTVFRMMIAGVLGLAIYKWLKLRTSRPRPFQVYATISAAAPALDQFSFPSGHTLHAVSFSLVASAGFPELTPFLFPFALLIGASRPILGLHYPSDVLAGALLGALISQFVLLLG
jgi:undecaprenyl-diphosphatase